MGKQTTLTIEPLTRIEGHMGIHAEVNIEEKNIKMHIVMQLCSGDLKRYLKEGNRQMLYG